VYVTFARQNATGSDAMAGPGLGYIDQFNLDGSFVRRVVSNGPLDAPWGMAIAPASFGPAAGALLVAEHGDGFIDAFNPVSGTFLGLVGVRKPD